MRNIRSLLITGAALGAAVVGGGAIASAATSTTTSPSTSPAPAVNQAPPEFSGPAHGTPAHENAEKSITGTAAAKAQAAAVKLAGGGSAGAVTSDMTGSGFETTVTKSDGTNVEVHMDSAYQAFQGPGGRAR